MTLLSSLIIALSTDCFVLGQELSPTETKNLADGVQIAAIVPTEPGQIGINPWDIPLPASFQAPIGADSSYLTQIVSDGKTTTSWIHTESDFGTVTITRTNKDGQPQPTTVPEGFRVAMVDGKLEITMSQWIKDIIDEIAAKVPACPTLKTRREWDHTRHEYLESRAPPDPVCVRLRTNRISTSLRSDSRVMEAAERLNQQVAEASGNDAAALYRAGQMETFTNERVAFEVMEAYEAEVVVVPQAAEILATVGKKVLGVVSAIAFFLGAKDILEDMWKLKADPQPMPIFPLQEPGDPPQPDTCN
ncbi:hypothetical protein PG984_008893 [Apiospora sp. TS-2023a]